MPLPQEAQGWHLRDSHAVSCACAFAYIKAWSIHFYDSVNYEKELNSVPCKWDQICKDYLYSDVYSSIMHNYQDIEIVTVFEQTNVHMHRSISRKWK
jgi:hypothetical protein